MMHGAYNIKFVELHFLHCVIYRKLIFTRDSRFFFPICFFPSITRVIFVFYCLWLCRTHSMFRYTSLACSVGGWEDGGGMGKCKNKAVHTYMCNQESCNESVWVDRCIVDSISVLHTRRRWMIGRLHRFILAIRSTDIRWMEESIVPCFRRYCADSKARRGTSACSGNWTSEFKPKATRYWGGFCDR